MKRHRRIDTDFLVEPLEPRLVCAAGAVSVQLVSGTWRVTGGNNADKIVMSLLANGNMRIQGGTNGGGATVVNQLAYVDIDRNHPVAVVMNGGDDDVELRGNSAAQPLRLDSTLSVSLGDGIDRLYTSYLTVIGAVSVNAGAGNGQAGYENVTFVNGDLGGLSYSTARREGWQNLNSTITTIRGNVSIIGSTGAMQVSMASTTITGEVAANMGGGQSGVVINKNLSMTAVTVGGAITVTGGPSRNTFSFSSVVADSITLYGGADLDQFGLNNSRFNRVRIYGYGGSQDRVWGSGNTFATAPALSGIEVNQLHP